MKRPGTLHRLVGFVVAAAVVLSLAAPARAQLDPITLSLMIGGFQIITGAITAITIGVGSDTGVRRLPSHEVAGWRFGPYVRPTGETKRLNPMMTRTRLLMAAAAVSAGLFAFPVARPAEAARQHTRTGPPLGGKKPLTARASLPRRCNTSDKECPTPATPPR